MKSYLNNPKLQQKALKQLQEAIDKGGDITQGKATQNTYYYD